MSGMPMLREGQLLGVIVVAWAEPDNSENPGRAAEAFAEQAVIAIENVRLFEAEQQRTRELTKSLERLLRQPEVLSIISSSRGELSPIFEAILANATRLCDARFGLLFLYEGGGLRTVAAHDVPPALAEARKRSQIIYPGAGNPLNDVIKTKQTLHTADLASTQAYIERDPPAVAAVELGGIRSNIVVPMLKDNELVGLIGVFRQEVRPFTDKHRGRANTAQHVG